MSCNTRQVNAFKRVHNKEGEHNKEGDNNCNFCIFFNEK